MGIIDRLRRRRPAEVVEENPWLVEEAAPQQQVAVANPWKPKSRITIGLPVKVAPPVEDTWRPMRMPSSGLKYRVLHSVSAVLILLNIVVGLFFYSSNMTLNLALLGYLGVSTVLLGHYFTLTR